MRSSSGVPGSMVKSGLESKESDEHVDVHRKTVVMSERMMWLMSGKPGCKEIKEQSEVAKPMPSFSLHQLDDTGYPKANVEGEIGSEVKATVREPR